MNPKKQSYEPIIPAYSVFSTENAKSTKEAPIWLAGSFCAVTLKEAREKAKPIMKKVLETYPDGGGAILIQNGQEHRTEVMASAGYLDAIAKLDKEIVEHAKARKWEDG